MKGTSSAALSGEEYRRRLFAATDDAYGRLERFKDLPYGSGSGFVSKNVLGNGFVFCVRIGDHPQPWFRYVRCDANWNVLRGEDGNPVVVEDTLTALTVADPESPQRERWLPPEVYDHAFDAWQVAQHDVFEHWDALTDPQALQPELPKSFRDATDYVRRAKFIERSRQDDLIARLNTVPTPKVQRAMAQAIREARTDEERIESIEMVLNDAGIQPAPTPTPLDPVELEQVRLVTWMAVRGVTSVEALTNPPS